MYLYTLPFDLIRELLEILFASLHIYIYSYVRSEMLI